MTRKSQNSWTCNLLARKTIRTTPKLALYFFVRKCYSFSRDTESSNGRKTIACTHVKSRNIASAATHHIYKSSRPNACSISGAAAPSGSPTTSYFPRLKHQKYACMAPLVIMALCSRFKIIERREYVRTTFIQLGKSRSEIKDVISYTFSSHTHQHWFVLTWTCIYPGMTCPQPQVHQNASQNQNKWPARAMQTKSKNIYNVEWLSTQLSHQPLPVIKTQLQNHPTDRCSAATIVTQTKCSD